MAHRWLYIGFVSAYGSRNAHRGFNRTGERINDHGPYVQTAPCPKTLLYSVLVAALAFSGPARSEDSLDYNALLVRRGITSALIYDGSVVANVSGGARRGDAYVGNLRLQVALDGKRLFHAPGWTAFLQLLSIHGGQPSNLIGDAQGVNSYSAKSTWRLYEAWGQYSSANGHWSFLAGRYDINSEFYRLASAGLFMNSSFAMGPEFSQSGIGGPSVFPDTSIGLRVAYKPTPSILIRAAMLDGEPVDGADDEVKFPGQKKGLLFVSEMAFLTRPASDDSHGAAKYQLGRGANFPAYDDKIAIGAWHYTGTFRDLFLEDERGLPVVHKGSSGAYALIDSTLYRTKVKPGGRISGFIQYGIGDGRVNRFSSYLSAGLAASGLITNRSDDQLGFAVTTAQNGPHYLNSMHSSSIPVARKETSMEATYLLQVNSKFSVQPDIQYVIDPGTDPARRAATVLQVHFQLKL